MLTLYCQVQGLEVDEIFELHEVGLELSQENVIGSTGSW